MIDEVAVEVEDLKKTYAGGVEAVRGVSFAVAPGEVFGLLGPNGAGKSTTIGMLTTDDAGRRAHREGARDGRSGQAGFPQRCP